MKNLNITNIHDNSKSQISIGLDSNKFKIKNLGSKISIEDDSNQVTSLKIGGSSGFTITYSGGKIKFSANSGSSPLTIEEPERGGRLGCPYYYSHRSKYGESSYSDYSLRSESSESISIETTNTTDNLEEVYDESKLPDATDLEDGTIMMTVGGHWVEYSFEDLYNMIMDKMNTEHLLNKI